MRFPIELIFLALTFFFPQQPGTSAPTTAPSSATNTSPAVLRVTGNVTTPLTLSASDLKSLPRKTLKIHNPHENRGETYEGVPVQELLRKAGVPQNAKLRGSALATYVLAEAADGYSVLYSLAELDTDFQDSDVIVADTMDGAPLGEKQGPFKIVAPHDKRPARWIRMLKSLTVVSVSPPKA